MKFGLLQIKNRSGTVATEREEIQIDPYMVLVL